MDEARHDDPFERINTFEWHEKKRDFEDVKGIFDGYTFVRRSDRHGEIRYQIFGYVDRREVAVACTIRGNVCWLISARRARRDERRKYYEGLAGRPPTGQD
jgi:uncharacterized DUF497 family protein